MIYMNLIWPDTLTISYTKDMPKLPTYDWEQQKPHLIGHLRNIEDAYANKRVLGDTYLHNVAKYAADRLEYLEQQVKQLQKD